MLCSQSFSLRISKILLCCFQWDFWYYRRLLEFCFYPSCYGISPLYAVIFFFHSYWLLTLRNLFPLFLWEVSFFHFFFLIYFLDFLLAIFGNFCIYPQCLCSFCAAFSENVLAQSSNWLIDLLSGAHSFLTVPSIFELLDFSNALFAQHALA